MYFIEILVSEEFLCDKTLWKVVKVKKRYAIMFDLGDGDYYDMKSTPSINITVYISQFNNFPIHLLHKVIL